MQNCTLGDNSIASDKLRNDGDHPPRTDNICYDYQPQPGNDETQRNVVPRLGVTNMLRRYSTAADCAN